MEKLRINVYCRFSYGTVLFLDDKTTIPDINYCETTVNVRILKLYESGLDIETFAFNICLSEC